VGPYVFRNGLTHRAEVAALVRHAMEVEGLRTFGILHPRHPFGEELAGLFWEEVERRRGEVRAVESYEVSATTFQDEVRRLVGRDAQVGGADHQRALARCASQPDAYRQARCREAAGQSVRPRIDFDGLFLPDYPQKIAMVSAALAFEDVIVEKDPRRLRVIEKTLGREVRPVTLLGTSSWNAPELAERAQRNVENALFTDAFFPASEDPATRAFVEAYQERHRRLPRLYPEALFHDSARLLAGVLAEARPRTREELRAALRKVSAFAGVTGKTSFAAGGDAEKSMRLLTVKDGAIRELAPPAP
jgi:ABC-type branched-subunit amino acid transport system substrate-binding protein